MSNNAVEITKTKAELVGMLVAAAGCECHCVWPLRSPYEKSPMKWSGACVARKALFEIGVLPDDRNVTLHSPMKASADLPRKATT